MEILSNNITHMTWIFSICVQPTAWGEKPLMVIWKGTPTTRVPGSSMMHQGHWLNKSPRWPGRASHWERYAKTMCISERHNISYHTIARVLLACAPRFPPCFQGWAHGWRDPAGALQVPHSASLRVWRLGRWLEIWMLPLTLSKGGGQLTREDCAGPEVVINRDACLGMPHNSPKGHDQVCGQEVPGNNSMKYPRFGVEEAWLILNGEQTLASHTLLENVKPRD